MSVLRGPQFVRCFAGEALSLVIAMDPPESIAGWALAFTLRAPGGGLAAQATVGNGITVIDGPVGVFVVPLMAPEQAGNYLFDAWRTDTNSEACLAYGALLVQARVRP